MSCFEKGTIVLSIDDGRKDAYRLYQDVLKKYKVPATFNIVTSWLGRSTKNEGEIITEAELREMSDDSMMEIAAHSHTHSNREEDILEGNRRLYELLDLKGPIGFASPGSGMKSDFVLRNEEKLKDMGFLYVRSCEEPEFFTERQWEVSNAAKNSGCMPYAYANAKRFAYEFDHMFVNSVCVVHDTAVQELKQLIDLLVQERACVVLLLHSVLKEGEAMYDSYWSYDYDQFKELVMYADALRNQGVLDICTNKDAFVRGCTISN